MSSYKTVVTRTLEFIYTLASGIGKVAVELLQLMVPVAKIPSDLADPIGFLVILTIFLALAEVARKLTWVVLLVGWLFIALRIVLVLVGG